MFIVRLRVSERANHHSNVHLLHVYFSFMHELNEIFTYKRRTSNAIIKAVRISRQQQCAAYLFVRFVYSICYGHKIFFLHFYDVTFSLSLTLSLCLSFSHSLSFRREYECVVLNEFCFCHSSITDYCPVHIENSKQWQWWIKTKCKFRVREEEKRQTCRE